VHQLKKPNQMKKILLLTFLFVIISCQKNEYYTKEVLAEKVFKSLQENDYDLFKKSVPSYDLVQKVTDMTASDYDNYVTKAFVESQEEFTKKGFKASDFELFKVNEPYRTYEIDSFDYIRYYVIIKNKDNVYLTLDFLDCIKTSEGFKLGEPIDIKK
jgi:hypothetical protein